jgi:hypothetical protein
MPKLSAMGHATLRRSESHQLRAHENLCEEIKAVSIHPIMCLLEGKAKTLA